MQPEALRNVVKCLSDERINAYGNDHQSAISAYTYNILLCESFYPVLHFLEVGLRNAVDRAFTQKLGAKWISDPRCFQMEDAQFDLIAKTKQRLNSEGAPITRGRVIGKAPFAFWTGLLEPAYEHRWHSVLKTAFPNLEGTARKRATIADRFGVLRTFRNKVFHHDRIAHLNLEERHAQILEAMGWIDRDLVDYAVALDGFKNRFPVAKDLGDRILEKLAAKNP